MRFFTEDNRPSPEELVELFNVDTRRLTIVIGVEINRLICSSSGNDYLGMRDIVDVIVGDSSMCDVSYRAVGVDNGGDESLVLIEIECDAEQLMINIGYEHLVPEEEDWAFDE